MKIKSKIAGKWNTYYCHYSDSLGWIKQNILEVNFGNFNQVILQKSVVNKNPDIEFVFDDEIYIFYFMTNEQYPILGEPRQIFSSRKLVYHPSFIMDRFEFFHCVWTSLRADEENNNLVNP